MSCESFGGFGLNKCQSESNAKFKFYRKLGSKSLSRIFFKADVKLKLPIVVLICTFMKTCGTTNTNKKEKEIFCACTVETSFYVRCALWIK